MEREDENLHKGMNFYIWKAVKNNPFVLTYQFNGVMVNKYEDDWPKEDKDKVKYGLKENAKITIAHGIEEFLYVSCCNIAKKVWDTLQVIHVIRTKVKRQKINTLNHGYELFRNALSSSLIT